MLSIETVGDNFRLCNFEIQILPIAGAFADGIQRAWRGYAESMQGYAECTK